MVPSEATLYPLSARTYAAFQVEPIIPAPNVQLVGYSPVADVRLPLGHIRSCRFSDAGMTMLSTRCGGRRPKSAKARNRGKWGTGGAAGAMES